MFDFGARLVLAKKVITFPALRRPDWPGNKTPTAIWTDVVENPVDTRGTERTLISTDACLS